MRGIPSSTALTLPRVSKLCTEVHDTVGVVLGPHRHVEDQLHSEEDAVKQQLFIGHHENSAEGDRQ